MQLSAVEKLDQSEQFKPMRSGIKQWARPVPVFDLVGGQSTARHQVETYINNKFEASYGATLTEYLPLLLTMRCADQLSGAAGISVASVEHSLFLEQYLDLPIEQELTRSLGSEIERQSIVEIGNLVATTSGASRIVFIVLASLLYEAGFEWMAFTATRPLLASLRKLDFDYHSLGRAQSSRLATNSAANWGSYYQNEPESSSALIVKVLIRPSGYYSNMSFEYESLILATCCKLVPGSA